MDGFSLGDCVFDLRLGQTLLGRTAPQVIEMIRLWGVDRQGMIVTASIEDDVRTYEANRVHTTRRLHLAGRRASPGQWVLVHPTMGARCSTLPDLLASIEMLLIRTMVEYIPKDP